MGRWWGWGLRLGLVLLVVGGCLLVRYVNCWYLFLLAVVFVLAVRFLGRPLLSSAMSYLFLTPFRMKGAVLRNATAQVHALTPAERPSSLPAPRESEDEAEGGELAERNSTGPREYYRLEVTITPRQPTGPFKHWEPGELRLGTPGRKWDDEEDDACSTEQGEIEQDGAYRPDEGLKFFGPQRLRLLIGVRPGTDRLEFRYYLEKFGEVRIYQRDITPG